MGRQSQERMLGRSYEERKAHPRGVKHTKWMGNKKPSPFARMAYNSLASMRQAAAMLTNIYQGGGENNRQKNEEGSNSG